LVFFHNLSLLLTDNRRDSVDSLDRVLPPGAPAFLDLLVHFAFSFPCLDLFMIGVSISSSENETGASSRDTRSTRLQGRKVLLPLNVLFLYQSRSCESTCGGFGNDLSSMQEMLYLRA